MSAPVPPSFARRVGRPVATALAAATVAMPASPALAATPKNWQVLYEPSLQATTNLQQQASGMPDTILRNNLELSYFPAADADNSALFRVQALNSRFLKYGEYDSTILIATGLASRRLYDSLFAYGGYQFIYRQGDSPGSQNRRDNDVFAGTVLYRPVGQNGLLFHGYQFDFLRAAVEETGYQGHTGYVTYRDQTTDRWTNSVGFRSQLRLYDAIGEMEWRNQLTGETSYRIFDWWSLVGEAIYLNSTSSHADFTFAAWNFGVFSRFTL